MSKEYLPGDPSNRMVAGVRRTLKLYGGISPKHDLWRLTWIWANKIRYSYMTPSWPSSHEIAALYMALVLSEMKSGFCLRLPYRASDHVPPEVLAKLDVSIVTALAGTHRPAELPAAPTTPKALPPAAELASSLFEG